MIQLIDDQYFIGNKPVKPFSANGEHTDDELAFYNLMLPSQTSNQREALYSQYIQRLEQRIALLEQKFIKNGEK